MPGIDDILDDFAVLDDWEERYRYVIELGKDLPPMPDELKTQATKVAGCASQVWIFPHAEDRPAGKALKLTGDSDALIVKGLMAIAFRIFDGLPLAEVAATDAGAIFEKLGLREHLTPQRANGLASMIRRIKADSVRLLAE